MTITAHDTALRVLLLTAPLPSQGFVDAIRAQRPGLVFVEGRPDPDDATLAGIDAILGWRLQAGLAPRMPRLRWVSGIAAGVDKLLPADLPEAVTVTRIVDPQQAEGIAQYVMAVVLQHVRELPRYRRQQAAHDWSRTPVTVARPRALVLGTGAMGSAIIAGLRRAGLDAHGWNRRSGTSLQAALPAADVVVCALPLTPETADVLDARAFAAMKPGSFLVNVARGEHVVEADLITAVRSGHLAGAALDVQRREPMDADDPLWDVPGIVITPHIAAQPSVQAIADQFVAAADALARGAPLPNAIDRKRGY